MLYFMGRQRAAPCSNQGSLNNYGIATAKACPSYADLFRLDL